MAWYCLRGHTVVYRAVIRDGGLDLRDTGKSIINEVQIYGAETAIIGDIGSDLEIDNIHFGFGGTA